MGYVWRRLKFKVKKQIYKKHEENKRYRGVKFAHVTYYAIRNAGDTVLSKYVRRIFEKLGGVESWEIINVSSKVTRKTIKKINHSSAVVIGGGGLFLPDTNENMVSGWQWAVSKKQLDEIRVPIMIYSVGFNYFRGQEPIKFFKDNISYLMEKAQFVGLRNMGSVRAIREIVGEEIGEKIVYQPCATTIIRKLFEDTLHQKKQTNTIAFNMAFDRESLRYGEKKDIILHQVARTAKMIEDRGYQIAYILHCKDDRKFIPCLREEKVHFQVYDLSILFPEKCIQVYNEMDMVLGMRGHAQMIPFGLNCEIISLGTHDKMKWFLEDIEAIDWYEELTFEPERLSERLMDKFITIHETDHAKTKRRLIEQQEKLWNITVNNWKTISGIVCANRNKNGEADRKYGHQREK